MEEFIPYLSPNEILNPEHLEDLFYSLISIFELHPESLPAISESTDTKHHPDVGIWWNLFPVIFWFTPTELFFQNLGILPLFIVTLPLQYLWNFLPFFIMASPFLITGGLAFVALGVFLFLIWVGVIIFIFTIIASIVALILFSIFVFPFMIYVVGSALFLYVVAAIIAGLVLTLFGGVFGFGAWVVWFTTVNFIIANGIGSFLLLAVAWIGFLTLVAATLSIILGWIFAIPVVVTMFVTLFMIVFVQIVKFILRVSTILSGGNFFGR